MRSKISDEMFILLEPIFLLLDPGKVQMVREYLVDGAKVNDIMAKHSVTKPTLYLAIQKFEEAKAGYLAAEARKEMLTLDVEIGKSDKHPAN